MTGIIISVCSERISFDWDFLLENILSDVQKTNDQFISILNVTVIRMPIALW